MRQRSALPRMRPGAATVHGVGGRLPAHPPPHHAARHLPPLAYPALGWRPVTCGPKAAAALTVSAWMCAIMMMARSLVMKVPKPCCVSAPAKERGGELRERGQEQGGRLATRERRARPRLPLLCLESKRQPCPRAPQPVRRNPFREPAPLANLTGCASRRASSGSGGTHARGRNALSPFFDGASGTPVLVLQRDVGVGEEAVLLHDGGAQDHEPTEHRVPPVPPLRLDRRAEAVLGQPGEVSLKFDRAEGLRG